MTPITKYYMQKLSQEGQEGGVKIIKVELRERDPEAEIDTFEEFGDDNLRHFERDQSSGEWMEISNETGEIDFPGEDTIFEIYDRGKPILRDGNGENSNPNMRTFGTSQKWWDSLMFIVKEWRSIPQMIKDVIREADDAR